MYLHILYPVCNSNIYIYRPRAKMENTSFMEGVSFDRLGILQQPSLLVGYNGVYST